MLHIRFLYVGQKVSLFSFLVRIQSMNICSSSRVTLSLLEILLFFSSWKLLLTVAEYSFCLFLNEILNGAYED